LYNENEDFRNGVLCLGALAFVPPADVALRFSQIKEKYHFKNPIRKIYSYFQENYIGYTSSEVPFPIPFWNCYVRFQENVPRTTNNVEGWHLRMNYSLPGVHPNPTNCIKKLQSEQQHWEIEFEKIKGGIRETQKRKYRQLDEKLSRIIGEYMTGVETYDCLVSIGKCTTL